MNKYMAILTELINIVVKVHYCSYQYSFEMYQYNQQLISQYYAMFHRKWASDYYK